MWRLVFAGALCGCYSPRVQEGVPCDPSAPVACPSGQTCEPAPGGGFECTSGDTDDAGMGGEANADSDGDGLVDSFDNCPAIANVNQADEDGDETGDACDPCPPFADTTDGDGDGLPDACDPRPGLPGDTITLFEGFADGLPPAWTAHGTWTVANGTLISFAIDNDLSRLVVPYISTPHQTIYSIATITDLTSDSGGSIGIVDRFDDDGSVGVHCGGGRANSDAFGLINAATNAFIESVAYPFGNGQTYRLQLARQDARHDCTTRDVNDIATTVTASPNISGGAFIGFRNRIASSAFPWLMVVKSP